MCLPRTVSAGPGLFLSISNLDVAQKHIRNVERWRNNSLFVSVFSAIIKITVGLSLSAII